MALTGLQAYKYLPKTNCAECGYSTCLAFGMALAGGKTQPLNCPYANPELSKLYEENFTTPVKEVSFGTGVSQTVIGGEKVMYRHEESFYNKAAIALAINAEEEKEQLQKQIANITDIYFERAGSKLFPDTIAIYGNNSKSLLTAASLIPETKSIIIICQDHSEIIETLAELKELKPLFCCSEASPGQIRDISKKFALGAIVKYTDFIKSPETFSDFPAVIELEGTLKQQLEASLRLRAEAVHARKPTPPVIAFLDEAKNMDILFASALINRFANAMVLTAKEKNRLLPLLTLRQNIYTDPRKPIRVEPGIYPCNNPSENSPILITTNFSLTHFLVSGETEASRIPAWILAVDTDGTSLLTAWASDKFNAEKIKAALEKNDPQKEKKGPLVISAYVSSLQEDIEKATERKISVGPADASGISPWLKRSFSLNG